MPFQPIATRNLASAAAAQLRELIATDILKPGDALPGERELASRFGISRTSLREALQTLVAEGLLVSKHGSGLRVSQDIGNAVVSPLVTLLESAPDAASDYLSFRAMFEGEAAYRVAETAVDAELTEIDRIAKKLAKAHRAGNRSEEVELDAEFHMAIVEATGNVVSIQIARTLHELLRRSVKQHHLLVYGDENAREQLLAQHLAINSAIQKRSAKEAKAAMEAHFKFLSDMVGLKAEEKRRKNIVKQRQIWAEEVS